MENEEISDKWAVLQNVSRRQEYKAYHNWEEAVAAAGKANEVINNYVSK